MTSKSVASVQNVCEFCPAPIAPALTICAICEERETQEAEAEYQKFLDYDGDEFLLRPWLEGETEERARQEVRDPRFLRMCLELGGLEYILKDRWASKGLFDALIKRHAGVVFSLGLRYALKPPPPTRRKPGPKRDPNSGRYRYERILELHKKGLSAGQIARPVYGDSKFANRVSATLSRQKRATKDCGKS